MPFQTDEIFLNTDISSDSAWSALDPVGSTAAEQAHFEGVVEETIKDALTRMNVAATDYMRVKTAGRISSKAYRLLIEMDVQPYTTEGVPASLPVPPSLT